MVKFQQDNIHDALLQKQVQKDSVLLLHDWETCHPHTAMQPLGPSPDCPVQEGASTAPSCIETADYTSGKILCTRLLYWKIKIACWDAALHLGSCAGH